MLEASGGGPGKPVGRVAAFEPPDERTYIVSNFFRTFGQIQTKCYRDFLLWRLLQLYTYPSIWSFQQQTTGIINLKSAEYLAQMLEWPPLAEQRAIAAILDTIDAAIQQTDALIGKLRQMKAGLLHDLLTRGLDDNGELRDPVAHPEQFKASALGPIPRAWEVDILDHVVKIIDCKHYTPTYVAEGIPLVRPRNVKVGGLGFSDIDYVSEREYCLLTDKHEPHRGDIVFSRNASFGVPCYVNFDQRFAIGQDVVIMTELEANTQFVYYVLLSDNALRQIQNVSAGSTFGRINLGSIRELLIPLPPQKRKDPITIILSSYDERIRAEEATREKLALLKRGLMDDLLTGRVRVVGMLSGDPSK